MNNQGPPLADGGSIRRVKTGIVQSITQRHFYERQFG